MGAKWLLALALLSIAPSVFTKTRSNDLSVSAKSAVVIDANSGAVLWSKNPDERAFPASTTKIMTALLLLQNRNLLDTMTAPNGIEKVEPSSMHLRSGEQLSVHDLMYAMMLRSANDAAVTVAFDLAGSRQKFADMMNQEAISLGCTGTHFNNPNGLDDPDHWTTAADMAKIARAAMQIPFFRDVVRTKRYKISRSINQKDLVMTNRDKVLRADPTQDGIKTGWTVPAGHCFVGSATRDGFRVISVEFHSNDWTADNQSMMDWAFSHFKHIVVDPAGQVLGKAALKDQGDASLSVGLNEPLEAITSIDDKTSEFKTTFELSLPSSGAIHKGDKVGMAFAWNGAGEKVGEAPLVAMESVQGGLSSSKSSKSGLSLKYPIGCLLIVGGIIMYRKRARYVSSGWNLKI